MTSGGFNGRPFRVEPVSTDQATRAFDCLVQRGKSAIAKQIGLSATRSGGVYAVVPGVSPERSLAPEARSALVRKTFRYSPSQINPTRGPLRSPNRRCLRTEARGRQGRGLAPRRSPGSRNDPFRRPGGRSRPPLGHQADELRTGVRKPTIPVIAQRGIRRARVDRRPDRRQIFGLCRTADDEEQRQDHDKAHEDWLPEPGDSVDRGGTRPDPRRVISDAARVAVSTGRGRTKGGMPLPLGHIAPPCRSAPHG